MRHDDEAEKELRGGGFCLTESCFSDNTLQA